MKKIRSPRHLQVWLLLATFVALASCEKQSLTAPPPNVQPTTIESPLQVQFTMSMEMVPLAFDWAGNPSTVRIFGNGVGNCEILNYHCTIEIDQELKLPSGQSDFYRVTITDGNGDQIFADGTKMLNTTPTSDNGDTRFTGIFRITGGSGRYAHIQVADLNVLGSHNYHSNDGWLSLDGKISF